MLSNMINFDVHVTQIHAHGWCACALVLMAHKASSTYVMLELAVVINSLSFRDWWSHWPSWIPFWRLGSQWPDDSLSLWRLLLGMVRTHLERNWYGICGKVAIERLERVFGSWSVVTTCTVVVSNGEDVASSESDECTANLSIEEM